MYLMFVDESGDTGISDPPSGIFILSSIVIHESSWLRFLDDLIELRRSFKSQFGLKMSEEIHASEMVNGRPGFRAVIRRNDRLDILKQCLDWLNQRNDVSVITVKCDKTRGDDVFDFTWRTLIQRFENTLGYDNFPGGFPANKGIIICDNTNGGKLTSLLRMMRRFNVVPNQRTAYGKGSRNMRLKAVIEDPVFRDSGNSYIHQLVDVVAYFARQYYLPNSFVKKKSAQNFYSRLTNVTNSHVTYYRTPFNIVEI